LLAEGEWKAEWLSLRLLPSAERLAQTVLQRTTWGCDVADKK
jgi:hypothetical protein